MTNLDSDPWIVGHVPIAAEKLHALGVITWTWNACEFTLHLLFCEVSGLDWKRAWAIVHDMGDIGKSEAISQLQSLGEETDNVKDAVCYALKLLSGDMKN
jgi:hypothetical protein